MARKNEDRFSNMLSAEVTETAAGSLTYTEIVTGISLGMGIGMLIDKIEYDITGPSLALLVAAADSMDLGWLTSNAPTNISITDRRVIHKISMRKGPIIGTAASSAEIELLPKVFEFKPAIIFAAPRLYLAVQGGSLTAVVTLRSRIYFRYIELTDKEYLELAETFILVG